MIKTESDVCSMNDSRNQDFFKDRSTIKMDSDVCSMNDGLNQDFFKDSSRTNEPF